MYSREQAKKIIESIPDRSVWIDNMWNIDDGETYKVIDPATQEVLKICTNTSNNMIQKAIESSIKAKREWRHIERSKKRKMFQKLISIIEDKKNILAIVESLNNGKTVNESLTCDIEEVIDTFSYYSGEIYENVGEVIQNENGFINYSIYEPVGVVGAIIPWNYPLIMLAWKLAPALATGNVVILKPSELTPLSAMIFMEMMKEAGFPAGVVNLITGDGRVGDYLARNNNINKIAFTGSRETGTKILNAASQTNLKRVSLELGGKSPNIVFNDADEMMVINKIISGIFFNKGEVCAAGSRLIIQRAIYDRIIESLMQKANEIQVGDPFNDNNHMGAIISKKQLEKIKGYIKKGLEEGATLLCGGYQELKDGENGNYIRPTIFTDVTSNMTIAKEEIFGPVLSILIFDDEEEAIEIANSTIYGLVAGIWSKDVVRGLRMAACIDAGTVWINDFGTYSCTSPFGGYKQSGWLREKGKEALRLYQEVKSIWLPTGYY